MLLELSRTESDLQSQSEEFDLVELVRDMIDDRRVATRITLTTSEKLPVVLHHAATRELLSILLDNALSHSPDESPIYIKLERRNDRSSAI